MRIPTILISMLLLAVPATTAPAAAPAPASEWSGVWRNAANSVRIRARPCGASQRAGMCGTVIWASPKARADVAARGRTLIGAQLFRDFQREDDGVWHGEVYVPDLGARFTGTIRLDGRDTLIGEGCLIAGFGCRSQTWTRVR